jgi:hypothetical protein
MGLNFFCCFSVLVSLGFAALGRLALLHLVQFGSSQAQVDSLQVDLGDLGYRARAPGQQSGATQRRSAAVAPEHGPQAEKGRCGTSSPPPSSHTHPSAFYLLLAAGHLGEAGWPRWSTPFLLVDRGGCDLRVDLPPFWGLLPVFEFFYYFLPFVLFERNKRGLSR